jgi:hypothetical protein
MCARLGREPAEVQARRTETQKALGSCSLCLLP